MKTLNQYFKLYGNKFTVLIFYILGVILILKTYHHPIADFGNYYYGSKLFLNGLFTNEMYTSIHYFNTEIEKLGEVNYFENYIPIPPISALLYSPFCVFKPFIAKLIFNLLSLLLFCFSLYKLLNKFKINTPTVILLPILFIYPLYNNIYQGQTYLFIISAMMLAYTYSENNKIHLPAILLALCISLKLFPVFILLYFILNKKHKIAVYTLLYVLLLNVMVLVFINAETVLYYFTHIVPRLLNNDIVGCYSAINQSIYSLLLNLYTTDTIYNINPIIQFSILVPIIESVFIGFILYYIYAHKNAQSFFVFGLVLFSSSLINRYNTTYSLILLVPFLVYVLNEFEFKLSNVVLLLVFLIGINLPVGLLINYPLVIKFSRIILCLVAFIFIVNKYKINIKLKPLLGIVVCIFLLKYFTFNIKPISYFEVQSTKGILYNIELKNDSLVLYSTLGEKQTTETFCLKGNVRFDKNLTCTNNILKYNNTVICNTDENKLNPFIYNDSLVVFMSDLNQGIRFYKLRYLSLNEK